MKDEDKLYKLAQKIDNYKEEKDGCYWGHILDIVTQAYEFGKTKRGKK